MNDPRVEYLSNLISSAIERQHTRTSRVSNKLNYFKSIRIICGVFAIALISLSGFAEFGEDVRFWISLAALAATTVTTLSDDFLSHFGFSDRYVRNQSTVNRLKALRDRLNFEVVMAISSSENSMSAFESIDYWEYQKNFQAILNGQNEAWKTAIENNKNN